VTRTTRLGGRRDDQPPNPLTFRKHGGRKLVVMLVGAPWAPRPRVDIAMVKLPMQNADQCETKKQLARAKPRGS
jgi:hypothetical protein